MRPEFLSRTLYNEMRRSRTWLREDQIVLAARTAIVAFEELAERDSATVEIEVPATR